MLNNYSANSKISWLLTLKIQIFSMIAFSNAADRPLRCRGFQAWRLSLACLVEIQCAGEHPTSKNLSKFRLLVSNSVFVCKREVQECTKTAAVYGSEKMKEDRKSEALSTLTATNTIRAERGKNYEISNQGRSEKQIRTHAWLKLSQTCSKVSNVLKNIFIFLMLWSKISL